MPLSLNSNDDEENGNATTARKIPRNYFVSGAKITEINAAVYVGRNMKNGDNNTVEEVMNDMRSIDTAAKSFAAVGVKKLMLAAAKERKILRKRNKHGLCETFKDLQIRWGNWKPKEEPNLRKDFFHVAIGCFDGDKDWDTRLEREFMSKCNYEYEIEEEVEKKKYHKPKATFILDLVHKQKTQYAKTLFFKAKKTHQLYLCRTGTTRGSDNVVRRKKGVYSDNLLRSYKTKGCPANIGKFMVC